MIVLKKPRKFKNFTLFCQSCEAELEIESSDIKAHQEERGQRDPYAVTAYHAVCVCCGARISVPESSVPVVLQKTLSGSLLPGTPER